MSTSLRVWYSAVFAVGAAAIVAGGVLAQPSSETASGHPVQAGVVLVSTNPTVSMKARASDNQKWQSKFTPVMGRLNDSLKAFNASAKSQDFAAMQASCGRLGVAARDMGATLPGPRKDLTAAIQGAVDNFLAAGSKCDTLTPEAGQDAVAVGAHRRAERGRRDAERISGHGQRRWARQTGDPHRNALAAAHADGWDLTRSPATVRLTVG